MANGVFAPRAGSIDSLAPARSPLRGFVDVARLPPAPFPPPPPQLARLRWLTGFSLHAPVRLIRSLPLAHRFAASSMSLGSRRLHSRPRLQNSRGCDG